MNKIALRKKYKELRNQLSAESIESQSLAIANRLLQLDIWDKTYFHLFLTIEELKEVDTEYVLQILAGKDKEIVVSKSDFESLKMIHFLLNIGTQEQDLQDLLLTADYIEDKTGELTASGFQFVLMDEPSQVH